MPQCDNDHKLADAFAAAKEHDHEKAGEDFLDAAASSDDPREQDIAMQLAHIEAQLALARNVGRIAAVLELSAADQPAVEVAPAPIAVAPAPIKFTSEQI